MVARQSPLKLQSGGNARKFRLMMPKVMSAVQNLSVNRLAAMPWPCAHFLFNSRGVDRGRFSISLGIRYLAALGFVLAAILPSI